MTWFADSLICLRFFSRLPVPETARERALGARGLAEAAAMAPVAGAIIGFVPALAVVAASYVGLPPPLAATLALAALVVVTGALHEDALADCADGFGGGRTPERKIEIMHDSRIGAFGACALVLSLMLRIEAISAIMVPSPISAAAVVIAAASLSRVACLLPLILLPPARAEGLGAATAGLEMPPVAVAIGLGVIAVAGLATRHPITAFVALLLGLLAVALLCLVSKRQVGGQTGDVVGTVQQTAETVVLLVFAAAT